MVIPLGATSDAATTRQVEIDATMLDYGVLFEGTRGLSLADSCEIRKVKAYLPDDWDEGTAQLYAYLSIFAAIHGHNHHVTIELLAALKLFDHHRPSFKQGFSELWGCRFGIIKFVYYFHLKMHRWYSKQWDPATTGAVKAPSFCDDLNKWIDDSIVANWIPNTHGVSTFLLFHQANDAYHSRTSTPARAPLTPQHPNPVTDPNLTPPAPRLT